MSIRLKYLLQTLKAAPAIDGDKLISGLTQDSRTVTKDDVFVALAGYSGINGIDYVYNAISAGAAAILIDEGLYKESLFKSISVPVIPVKFLRHHLGDLANIFYGHPSRNLQVLGVTGTNGKTSVCHFLAAVFAQLNCSCGVMGTLGVGIPGRLTKTLNTTQDVLSNHQHLKDFLSKGIRTVAMEVSSHSLHQGRVDGIEFFGGIFTNLSHDHLDYHGSMENYGQAKLMLFREHKPRYAVINKDDAFSSSVASACDKRYTTILFYSASSNSSDVYVSNVKYDSKGTRCIVHTPWGNEELYTPLLGGQCTIENLLSVITILGLRNYSLNKVLSAISSLECVPGRMQKYGGNGKPSVIVDYAHTPEALARLLSVVREHGANQVICIFGCGGDRDSEKRNVMGKIAVQKADRIVVTSDNPRTEDPESIIADIILGIHDKVEVIIDRKEAIHQVINQAHSEDLVIVAGKGHEDYQEVMSKRYHFDDREQVCLALKEWQSGWRVCD